MEFTMQRQTILLASLSVLGTLIILSTADAAIANSQIRVKIASLRNQRGNVCLTLFNGSQGFPSQSDRAVASRCINAEEGTAETTFDDLAPGDYAIAVIHDENKDGKLNTGLFGIPTEGFGFSQNPKVRMGAPSFKDTAFPLSGTSTPVQIDLKYIF